ncbi:serine/threonine protein phosphatase [Endomicrobiia bacterium]|nr:serine/threonine protein phosphatase [Endomicrobiia bacterium]
MTKPWTVVQRFEKNKTGRDFVCGDIHGCFDDLEYQLRKNRFDPKTDRLFCVGDMFDRGPRSRDALGYMQANWLYTVMGNHEHMFLELYLKYTRLYKNYTYHNGSDWQYKESYDYIAKLAKAVDTLPLIIKVDDTLILHSCLPDVDSLEEIENNPEKYLEKIIWYRGRYPEKIRIPGIKRVYCGHTFVDEPEDCNGMINIDTGAFLRYQGFQGKLTVVELKGRYRH